MRGINPAGGVAEGNGDDDKVRGFLVERGTPGFSPPQMKGKLSLRASVTSELILDNVVVDEGRSLLPGAVGPKGPRGCLNQARYGIAWGEFGAADHCCQTVLEIRRTARTMLGANSIMGECPIMRHANNLESVCTYEGTHDLPTLIIGQEVTGISAFR